MYHDTVELNNTINYPELIYIYKIQHLKTAEVPFNVH